ncbi:MAG: hypothetical protein ACKVX7_13855 [Planctomycetota bacterium]
MPISAAHSSVVAAHPVRCGCGAPLRLLQDGGSHGGGNLLYVCERPERPLLLKVYRRRGGRGGEWFKDQSHRLFEGKRGVTARARFETELASMALWTEKGFDTFRRCEHALPAPNLTPSMWVEFCAGRSLADIYEDEATSFDEKALLTQRMAADVARRQQLAFTLDEPLLVQEHASIKHLFITGERRIWFDLENAYGPRYRVIEALAQELSGLLRSMARKAEAQFEPLLHAFVRGYTQRELLREIATYGVHHAGVYRRIKRWYDRRNRASFAKTTVLELLLEAVATETRAGADISPARTESAQPTPLRGLR